MVLSDGKVIDESLNIIWALKINDPQQLLINDSPEKSQVAMTLIQYNDNHFKPWLDKYKYADRYPEQNQQDYRQQAESFIAVLELRLEQHHNLVRDTISIADITIFPFIRQFAYVDINWWQTAPYPKVQAWLERHITNPLFIKAMEKYPPWREKGEQFIFAMT